MRKIEKCLIVAAIALIGMGCPKNRSPDEPQSPNPADRTTNQPDSLTLEWQCSDPDGDSLSYTLYFGTDSIPPLKAESLSARTYPVTNLQGGTTYYWKVTAHDEVGATSESPVWRFTTTAATGALRVSSTPAGADIFLDGLNTGLKTDTLLENVIAGKHLVKFCMCGYCDCQDSVEVIEDDTVDVSGVLSEAGVVAVTSSPAGARVLVDCSETGFLTNCVMPKVPVGTRMITLSKTGYQDWTKVVDVTAYDTVRIFATLIARYGSIQIESKPNNAEVWLDGQNAGLKTDCVLNNILEGNHTVTLKLPGYLDWTRAVTVYAGTTTAVDATLTGLGFVSVRSTPESAAVFLDGRDLQLVTPCLLTEVTEGYHTVSMKLTDYRLATQGVTVAVAETAVVEVVLQHETGRIQVSSTPEGAGVTLDAVPTNLKTPCVIESVWTGKHLVALELTGKYPCEDSVEVLVDQTVSLDTLLIPCEIGSFGDAVSAGEVCVVGKYAVIANGNMGVWVIDISDPIHPKLASSLAVGDFVKTVHIENKYVFIGTWQSGLSVIDISNPAVPVFVGTLGDSSTVQGIDVNGSYAYIVDKQGEFRIVDVSVPSGLRVVGSYQTQSIGEGIAVVDRYAYVADGSGGLLIFDVAVPGDPKLIGQSQGSIYAIDVEVSGNFAYVCDWKTGVSVFDISNRSFPKLVGTFYSMGSAEDVTLVGNYAYLADGVGGLRVLDCSAPSALFEVAWEVTPGYASSVHLSGPLAFVANGGSGVRIIRVGW